MKKKLKTVLGICFVSSLIIGLNFTVWNLEIFNYWSVLIGLVLVLTGGVWVILWIRDALTSSYWSGRAVSSLNSILSTIVFLGICITIYALVVRWDISIDLTAEGRRSLSPQTVKVLEGMTRDVKVLCFFINVDDEAVVIAREKTLRFLEQCRKYTPFLQIEVLDPQIDRSRLESLGITHASTQGTVVIRCGNRQKVIMLSGANPRMEERDFTNALISVLRETEISIGYLTGHEETPLNEPTATGLATAKALIEGESYKIEPFNISITVPEVPRKYEVVMIHNPKGDLHPEELRALGNFLAEGGSLIIFFEPWVDVKLGVSGAEFLRPWLKQELGVEVGSDIVFTTQKRNPWEIELRPDPKPFENVEEDFMEFRGCFRADHPITQRMDQPLVLRAVRTVFPTNELPKGVKVLGLLRTTPDYWAETDLSRLAEGGAVKFEAGEKEGPLFVAVAGLVEPQKSDAPRRRGKFIIVGDSDFITNERISIGGHVNFLLNSLAWLTEHEELISIRPTAKEDKPIVLSGLQRRWLVWASVLLTPQLVFLIGLLTFLVRRRAL
ncbi:MAG: GldG family protein [Candidatus Hydrogenedentes bacterium]|nr:GldG family protein [Candidatus Hydrogenedentota bacterium]